MKILTLTTDLGTKDHYASTINGSVWLQNPHVHISPISHEVKPHNINQGSFLLKQAWSFFPKGTVHIFNVNNQAILNKENLLIDCKGHYFLLPDNGAISLILGEQEKKVYSLPAIQPGMNLIRDLFVLLACQLFEGVEPSELGELTDGYRTLAQLVPTVHENSLRAYVEHVDAYGNLITNVSKKLFQQHIKNGEMNIVLREARERLRTIHEHYQDVPQGNLMAFFNEANLLELAINQGNASKLLNMHVNDMVVIEFKSDD